MCKEEPTRSSTFFGVDSVFNCYPEPKNYTQTLAMSQSFEHMGHNTVPWLSWQRPPTEDVQHAKSAPYHIIANHWEPLRTNCHFVHLFGHLVLPV
jgi:hypothetical protein